MGKKEKKKKQGKNSHNITHFGLNLLNQKYGKHNFLSIAIVFFYWTALYVNYTLHKIGAVGDGYNC